MAAVGLLVATVRRVIDLVGRFLQHVQDNGENVKNCTSTQTLIVQNTPVESVDETSEAVELIWSSCQAQSQINGQPV